MSPTVKFVMLGLVCVSSVKRGKGKGALGFRSPIPSPLTPATEFNQSLLVSTCCSIECVNFSGKKGRDKCHWDKRQNLSFFYRYFPFDIGFWTTSYFRITS